MKTFIAEVVEVTPETHENKSAFSDLYGKFYCYLPNIRIASFASYLCPDGKHSFTAHFYNTTEELNNDLRAFIASLKNV